MRLVARIKRVLNHCGLVEGQYVVVGSCVLNLHGHLQREPGDIDIRVAPDAYGRCLPNGTEVTQGNLLLPGGVHILLGDSEFKTFQEEIEASSLIQGIRCSTPSIYFEFMDFLRTPRPREIRASLLFAAASEAAEISNFPVGAAAYVGSRIIKGVNQLGESRIAHAEMDLLGQLGSNPVTDGVLVVTMEPCQMCASAMILQGSIHTVYWMVPDRFAGVFQGKPTFEYMGRKLASERFHWLLHKDFLSGQRHIPLIQTFLEDLP